MLQLIRNSGLATVLAEATVYNERDVKAIPLDVPLSEMDGCVHMLKNSYRKRSAIAFIKMLRESNAVRARAHDWLE